MITINGIIKARPVVAGSRLTDDDAFEIVNQIKQDASYGTFAALPDHCQALTWKLQPNTLVDGNGTLNEQAQEIEFTLSLSTDMFPLKRGGIQHLVGILAGDLFLRQSPKATLSAT